MDYDATLAPIAPPAITRAAPLIVSVNGRSIADFSPKSITFTGPVGKVVIDLVTGKVDTSGMPMDEAAKQFWFAVEKTMTIRCKTQE